MHAFIQLCIHAYHTSLSFQQIYFFTPLAGLAGLPVTVPPVFFCACAAAGDGLPVTDGEGFFAAADAGDGLPAPAPAGFAGAPVPAFLVASFLFAACALAIFAAFVLAKLLCLSLGAIVFGAGPDLDGGAVIAFCCPPLFDAALYFGMPVILAASLLRVRPRGLEAEPARTPGAPVASRT